MAIGFSIKVYRCMELGDYIIYIYIYMENDTCN
jgi:hypothetical protein